MHISIELKWKLVLNFNQQNPCLSKPIINFETIVNTLPKQFMHLSKLVFEFDVFNEFHLH